MSVYTDRVDHDRSLPITCSINIQTSSISKRPLTCYISTSPSKQFNSIKPISSKNKSRSTIHLPVTYSTSLHLPCPSENIKQSSEMIVPSPISYHHYHHYYHHHYYHQRESSIPGKSKISPHSTSIASIRPATTTSSTTFTTPDSSLSPVQKHQKNIFPSPPPSLPSYSALVWNWFHHRSTKPTSSPLRPHKGSQSEYSETCRHESPSKRTLLFKFLSTPLEKQSKSKQQRSCFTRKRFQSSSSLPTKTNHYQE